MKKLFVLSAVISSFTLSSCALFNIYNTNSKDIDIYEIDKIVNDENKSLEKDALKTPSKPLFISGEKYIPYFTLQQYADFYKPYFMDNVKSEVESDAVSSSWSIYIGEQMAFYAVISPFTKEIYAAGSISNAFKEDSDPKDYTSLYHQTKFTGSNERINEETKSISFKNCGFKSFRKDNVYYYPLGLLDNAFSSFSRIYFFYNYQNIYSSWDVENYALPFYKNGTKTSVDQEMEETTNGEKIPSYLIDYNANMFLFVLENFYGLKSTYNIPSIRNYFVKNNVYDLLFSRDDKQRGEAYSGALSLFDDNHTGLISVNNAWGEGETPTYGGKGVIKRSSLKKTLKGKRDLVFLDDENEIHYSQSQETAMFYFDSFSFGKKEDVFDEQNNVKEDAYKYDTFYLLLDYLTAIKEKGNVKNVVLDVSLNGGGTVAVMGKLLALISKDNTGIVSMYDESMGSVSTTTVKIDINGDEKYDENDCFGNIFDFYIMTSDCSFSCGNAFPCYAQIAGAKIIGEKSGGGECAVGVHYLPNSEYVYHSSPLHLGYFDVVKKDFQGFESGAKPDVSLVTNNKTSLAEYSNNEIIYNIPDDFYNVDSLENHINQLKSK